MLLSLFGCGPTDQATEQTTAPTEAAAEQPTTVAPTEAVGELYMLDYYQVGNSDSDARPAVEAAINAYIEPLINAHVTFHIIPWGDWTTKGVSALEAGEKMDIFFTADWSFYSKEVSEGLLTALNDDNGPNGNLLQQYGKDILTSLNPAFLTGSAINGVNYAIPTQKELSVPWGFVYNVAIADEIGFTDADAAAIKTMADIEPWLEKAKAAHPDMFTSWRVDWLRMAARHTNSDLVFQPERHPDASGKVDETIFIPMEMPWMEDYLGTVRGWMEKGHIDPNASSTFQTSEFFNAGKFFIEPMPSRATTSRR
jgi:putative aldouronate transport system substrate-binding protein